MSYKIINDIYIEYNEKLYVSRGEWDFPDGTREISYQPVRSAKGFKRRIYCKYCHKSVKPILSGGWQIICSVCGYGLTPDFFTKEELKYYMKTGVELDVEKDGDEKLKENHAKSMKMFKKRMENLIRIKKKEGEIIVIG